MAEFLAAGFNIGSLHITYYAIMICCGMILGAVGTAFLFTKRNISWDLVIDLFIVVIPCAIIGARVYYCTVLEYTKFGEIIPLREWFDFSGGGLSGLSILGGVLLGTVGVIIVCLIKKINFWRVGDCIAPCLLLGQVIGRWGNYFNGEVYGMVIDNPAWQWFPFAVDINGTYHLALFFIEGTLNLIGCVIMVIMLIKFKKKPNGLFVAGYFIYYGLIRSILEPLRDSNFMYTSSLVSSILFLVGGLALLAYLLYRNYKAEGALIGSKTGEPLVIYPRIDVYAKEREKDRIRKERKRAEKLAMLSGENTPLSDESTQSNEPTQLDESTQSNEPTQLDESTQSNESTKGESNDKDING